MLASCAMRCCMLISSINRIISQHLTEFLFRHISTHTAALRFEIHLIDSHILIAFLEVRMMHEQWWWLQYVVGVALGL